jgi:hypothetical protein
MQFTLQTLLLAFVLIWSSLAAFGPWGLAVAAILLAIVAYIRSAKSMATAAWNVFLVVLLVFLAVLFFLVRSVQGAREAGRRAHCANNQKQIALALQNYHEAHGHFPPAYVLGPDGKPWHSWRVLILPYLEYQSLYDQYRFDEPWNGPNNRKLASARPSEFACPADPAAFASGSASTNYVVVVGPRTAWPGDKPTCKGDFAGVENSTILVVEIANSGINWLEPRDLSFDDVCPGANVESGFDLSSAHMGSGGYFYHDQPYGANVAFVDSGVRFLHAGFPREIFAALLCRDGDKPADILDVVDIAGSGAPAFHWAHLVALVTLVLSFLLLLLRPRKRPPEAANPETLH